MELRSNSVTNNNVDLIMNSTKLVNSLSSSYLTWWENKSCLWFAQYLLFIVTSLIFGHRNSKQHNKKLTNIAKKNEKTAATGCECLTVCCSYWIKQDVFTDSGHFQYECETFSLLPAINNFILQIQFSLLLALGYF